MRRVLLFLVALLISLLFIGSVIAIGPVQDGTILVFSFVALLLFWFVICILLFAGVMFWIWMFMDCLVRDNYHHPNDRIAWLIVLLLTSVIGALVYYLLVKRRLGAVRNTGSQKRRKKKK